MEKQTDCNLKMIEASTSTDMDKFPYNYYASTNQLRLSLIHNNFIMDIVDTVVDENSMTINYHNKGYYKLYSVGENHKVITIPSKSAEKMLPWVHTSTTNAKRGLLVTYHRVDRVYLQNYLNEFCYKLNRNFGLKVFECLLVAACTLTWYT